MRLHRMACVAQLSQLFPAEELPCRADQARRNKIGRSESVLCQQRSGMNLLRLLAVIESNLQTIALGLARLQQFQVSSECLARHAIRVVRLRHYLVVCQHRLRLILNRHQRLPPTSWTAVSATASPMNVSVCLGGLWAKASSASTSTKG